MARRTEFDVADWVQGRAESLISSSCSLLAAPQTCEID
jgi:hypothetical protein